VATTISPIANPGCTPRLPPPKMSRSTAYEASQLGHGCRRRDLSVPGKHSNHVNAVNLPAWNFLAAEFPGLHIAQRVDDAAIPPPWH